MATRLITAKDIARALRVSLGTVYAMVRERRIPAVRVGAGRTLRFDLDAVKAALAGDEVASAPQRGNDDPLATIDQLAVKTGIKDLAEHHDHYLYGIPIPPG